MPASSDLSSVLSLESIDDDGLRVQIGLPADPSWQNASTIQLTAGSNLWGSWPSERS